MTVNPNDVAVVGMACVFPGACDLKHYWSNLVNGVDAITSIPPGRWEGMDRLRVPPDHEAHLACSRGGFLPGDLRFPARRFGIMPNIVRHGDTDQFLMVHLIDAALQDAQVSEDHPVRQQTDVILGRGGYLSTTMIQVALRADFLGRMLAFLSARFPGLGSHDLANLDGELRGLLPPLPTEALSACIPNLVASRASNRLNLRGAAYTVDAACTSSLVAVEQAVLRLRQHRCGLAVAGGIHLVQVPPFWHVFSNLKAVSAAGVIRPFDRRADGLLLGEGAGAVVLKRLTDACRDGDRVYAVLKGVGSASDGQDTGILSPSVRGQVQALEQAYADAGLDPATISFLEAHGTATVAGDLAEIETIQRVFGRRSSGPPERALGSVKSMIGHTMPAAGMASLIKTILALSNKILPPSLHCEEPRPELQACPFYVNTRTRPWIHAPGRHPRRAGVNAFGFGGINAHVILEEVDGAALPRPIVPGLRRGSEVFVFAGPSTAALARQVERLEQFLRLDQSDCQPEDIACTLAAEVDFSQPCKLALVARDRPHLLQQLAGCRDRFQSATPQFGDQDEIFFATEADRPRGKIAFLFPGMAFPGLIGNYPQHLMDLCLHYPEVRAELDRMDGKDQHPEDPVPFSTILSPPPSLPEEERERLRRRVAPPVVVEKAVAAAPQPPAERNLAGVGATISNWTGWVLLRLFEIPVDMVCGQSAGDLTALAAAGVLDFETDIQPRIWQGLAIPPTYTGRGRLAFVGCGEAQLAPFLADLPNTSIAIYVAPESVIAGGDSAEVAELVRRLRAAGFMATGLPFIPGHTPRMSYLRDQVVYAFDEHTVWAPARLAVYSALSCDLFPSDEAGRRERLLANLDHPVRFWQTNRRMYEDGARLFVQVGCGSLASNIQATLPSNDVLAAALDVEYRDPVDQLHRLCAGMFTAGVRYNLAPLFQHRSPRRLCLDQPQPKPPPDSGLVPLSLTWVPFPTEGLPEQLARKAATNPASPPAAPARRMPFLGRVIQFVPRQEILLERTLDLKEDLFLLDHQFVDPQTGKPPEQCLPVLPMTMMMELAAETAACLAPGLGLIGFEDVQAQRWIGLEDAETTTVRVQARLLAADPDTGVHAVRVAIQGGEQGSASATVLLGDRYRQDLALSFTELRNPRSWAETPEELYRERHLFHGPSFQCIAGLHVFGDRGMTAELIVPSKSGLFASVPDPELLTDPCVLDAAGQLVGFWIQTRDRYAFPLQIRKLEIYCPTPPVGTRVPFRMEITRMEPGTRMITADLEIQDGQGAVWMRLQGWTDWMMLWNRGLIDFFRQPARNYLSARKELPGLPLGGLCAHLRARDIAPGHDGMVARSVLTSREMEVYKTLGPERREQFLLGRVVAKDAARWWLARVTGQEGWHPARLGLANDSQGRPFLEPLPGVVSLPAISIAHSEGHAVALVTDVPAGIDLEPAARQTRDLLPQFAR
ncbi:MAG: polyketide synthase dehydratase domain-containing protein, partial [Planctomycetes bacterium]|nr:polyketide synthase dehydratase domain-containing protein [Planctomycetota bacterium]